MVTRWQAHITNGTFALAVDPNTPLGPMREAGKDEIARDEAIQRAGLWTQPWPYWDMKIHAPQLWQELKDKSGLVIFKVIIVDLVFTGGG
jgi:hypothetical protein